MTERHASDGRSVVMQPNEGPSYWQPVPANGYAHAKLTPDRTGFPGLSMGYQTIGPHSRVRAHSHDTQVEVQICFKGKGRAVIDGVSHDLVPGSAAFLGYNVLHEIINESDEDLVMCWVISPAGLEDFFASIGRARHEGEPTPTPFPRPTDVIAIERSLGMQNTK